MNESSVRPLTSVKPRQKALIVALSGGSGDQHRLISMGLHVGQEVEILIPCNREDAPAVIAAGETRVAIGHGMASQIMVAADPT